MNEFVIKYLKKARYEKTLKLLAGKDGESKACTAEAYKKFTNYLKQKERKTKNANNDDLGFEINFGAFKPEPKVSFLLIYQIKGKFRLAMSAVFHVNCIFIVFSLLASNIRR